MIGLLLSLLFNPYFAKADTPSAACTPFGIHSLHIKGLTHYSNISPDLDLCQNSETLNQYPALVALSGSVNTMMERVSAKLEIPQQVLYPTGIEITLQAGPLGNLDEAASGNEVILYQFPDWVSGGFDESGFAHELGHVIATTLPSDRAIIDLRSIPFLREGFPDLIAYVTTGSVFDRKANDLPPKINQNVNRDLTGTYSYQGTMAFYLETFVYQDLSKVCLDLSPSEQSQIHVKMLCETASKSIQDPAFQMTLAHQNEPFSADTCFNFWDPHWNGWDCDMHQLSLPWTSSLVNLAPEIALNFLKTLTHPSPTVPAVTLQCGYNSDSGKLNRVSVSIKKWEDLFLYFQTTWTTEEKAKWNTLASQAALDFSKDFGLKWEKLKGVRPRASAIMRSRYQSQTDPFYNNQNPCGDFSTDSVDVPPQCQIVCE